jgi:hypothetical protein
MEKPEKPGNPPKLEKMIMRKNNSHASNNLINFSEDTISFLNKM